MLNITEWDTIDSGKLCPLLRQKVIGSYYVHKWVPRILYSPVRNIKQRMTAAPVIVQLDSGHFYANLNSANLGGILGCQVDMKLDIIDGFTARVNMSTLKRLVREESVIKIWEDRAVNTVLDVASPAVNASGLWRSGLRGAGVGIAILDTGIYPHPDLMKPGKRIVAFKDFVNLRSNPYDDNGHGTHCAGDAAGNGFSSGRKYRGPASEASLIGVKVLDRLGSGTTSRVIAAIDWCIKRKAKYGIRVISLSLGTRAIQSYKDDPLCQAVEKAWKAGIVVCVAAGNAGPGAGTIGTPGIAPAVITVGALDDKNTVFPADDTVAPFSSRGPTVDGLTKPDLVAPGVNIISLRAVGSYIDRTDKRSRAGEWYTSLSGTSMAAPVCAGVVAQILGHSPELSPPIVKNLLMSTCRTVNSNVNVQGAGAIDALAAIRRLRQ